MSAGNSVGGRDGLLAEREARHALEAEIMPLGKRATCSPLATALHYLDRFGWWMFPCRWQDEHVFGELRKRKEPLIAHGFHAASNNPAQIERWWTKWPNALIGLATGASGLAVLDVDVKDPKKYGPDSLDNLGRSILDRTWISHTSSGGWHCYYDALETRHSEYLAYPRSRARCSRQHRLRHRPLAKVEIHLGPGQSSRRCSAGPGAGLADSAAARSQAHRFDQAGYTGHRA